MAKIKLTEELINDFCAAISMGLSINAACDYCMISEVSYYSYIKKAEEQIEKGITDSIYVNFFNRVKKAKTSFKIFHMAKIREAAESGSWQASAWSLERCYPNEFGKFAQIDVQDNGIVQDLVGALKELKDNAENR